MANAEDKCKDIKHIDNEYEEDKDTLLHNCWYPTSKTASRPTLIRDASFESVYPPEPKESIMKTSYLYPNIVEHKTLGVRKSCLLKKFNEEAEAEVAEERREKIEPNDYITTHDCSYQVEGYEPDDKFYLKHDDLYKKYPLYAPNRTPTTFASFQMQQNPSDIPQGVTLISNIDQPFKRSRRFTKPLNEVYDTFIR